MTFLLKLLNGPSLRTAAVYGLAGGGFVVSTLILAEVLDANDLGKAMLIIALCNVGIGAAPAGLNGIVLRHDLAADRRLLVTGVIAALLSAAVLSVIGVRQYNLDPVSAAVLFAAVSGGAATQVVKSSLQRAQKFQRAALLSQAANCGLIVGAVLMLVGASRAPWFPTAVVALSFAAIGWVAWRWAILRQQNGPRINRNMWRDAAGFSGDAFAYELLIQLERLIIPLILTVEDLAVFAVIAAVVMAPYRALQLAVGATLTARLRKAPNAKSAMALLRRETALMLFLSVAGGIVLLVAGPYLCDFFLHDGARASTGLIAATVVSGVARVMAAFGSGLAAAFCAGKDLRLINASVWLAVMVAGIASYALAEMGLAGVVYGVAIGWLVRGGLSAAVAWRHLKSGSAFALVNVA